MSLYKNISSGPVFFSRFKVKVDECVPAVEYTEAEQAIIDRFVDKGILVLEGSKPAVKVEVPTEKVAEVTPEKVEVLTVEETTDEDKETTKRGKKNK